MNSDNNNTYSGFDILKIAWGFTKNNRGLLVLSFFLNILFSIFSAITITLIKPILGFLFEVEREPAPQEGAVSIDSFEQIKNSFFDFFYNIITTDTVDGTLIRLGLIIIILFILKNIFKYLGAVIGKKFNENVIKNIRDSIFDKITSLSIDFFNRQKQGAIISKITNDVAVLNNTTIATITGVTRDIIQIIIFLFFLITISPKLTLIAFSTSIISLIFIKYSVKFLKRYASRMQNAMADFTTTLQESIGGIRVLKAYNARELTTKKFTDDTSKYVKSAIKHQKIMALIPSINEIWAILALTIVLVVGGQEVLIAKTVKADDLMTFLFMLFAVMTPITSLVSSFTGFQRGIVAGGRILDLLTEKSKVKEGTKSKNSFNNSIEFKDVSFAYNSENVLEDINIKLEKGKKIALVGASGSGKSTILDLITRFYDPTNGEILIDETNIKEFNIKQYRALFGIVSQETILFNDTVANNIIYGMEEVESEEIKNAAKISNALNFIDQLPDGFNTIIGDRGVTLSGGEKQRIAIARALIRNPEILIFDEATSALDAESEKVVQEAIEKSLKDKSAVIVAHRLSTIVNCDEIYVFKKGRVVESGNHSELIKKDGVYKKLYDIQYVAT